MLIVRGVAGSSPALWTNSRQTAASGPETRAVSTAPPVRRTSTGDADSVSARPAAGTVRWTHTDGILRIALTGEIDLSCRADIEKTTTAIADAMPRDVVVDVTEVTFFSSEGLRLLGEAVRITSEGGTQVAVHNSDAQIKRSLATFGMLDHLVLIQD